MAASRRILLPFFVLALCALGSSSRADSFDAANQAYDQGHFEQSKDGYEAIVKSGSHGPNVFYDLGNAWYKLGDPGRAILNYERALALQPSHPEARANLNFLRSHTGAKTRPAQWYDILFLQTSPAVMTIAAAAGFWLAAFLLVARRRAGLAFAALFVIAAYCAATAWLEESRRDLAIVLERQAPAHFAPVNESNVVETLPAGSQVTILSDRGAWRYCSLPDKNRGWIESDALEPVRLRPPS